METFLEVPNTAARLGASASPSRTVEHVAVTVAGLGGVDSGDTGSVSARVSRAPEALPEELQIAILPDNRRLTPP